MDKLLKIIDNETNQPWTVKILEKGDAYGRDNCLTHDDDKPLVEFYDGRYIENFGPEGQFVSRYYVETILESNGGLNAHGGVESWTIYVDAMTEVRAFLKDFTKYARLAAWGNNLSPETMAEVRNTYQND